MNNHYDELLGPVCLTLPAPAARRPRPRIWQQASSALHKRGMTQWQAAQVDLRITSLQTITGAFSRALTSAQVAEVIVQQGVSVLGADGGSLRQLTAAGDALHEVRTIGYDEETLRPYRNLSLTIKVPHTDAVNTREPVLIESLDDLSARYPHLLTAAATEAFRAFVAMPLLIDDRVIGTIGFTFRRPQQFSPQSHAFLVALAHHCAQALERTRLYEAALQAQHEAQQAIQLRDQFLSLAAHELKTPLTAMFGYAQLLQRRMAHNDSLAERDQNVIRALVTQSRRLDRMISALLDISRIEQGQLSIERASIDFGALAAHVIADLQPTLERHTLTYSVADGPLLIEGDTLRLEQVLQNLLGNAVKYSPHGGTVTVRLERRGDQAAIDVTDTGIGIPAAALPSLFHRFYRASNADSANIPGTGIGLYVVREIVALHGGSVVVTSEEGKGSTFTVCLPLAAPPTSTVCARHGA